ncbi:MAG: metallophosphoesterase family protein [Candidatus Micrarchaeia archaeon]
MRLFFASDLHGSEVVSNKLVNAALFYNVKNIVVGGDLAGKVLIPILKEGSKYRLNLYGEQKLVKEGELKDIEKELSDSGEYFRVMERSEYEEAVGDKAIIEKLFKEEMLKRLSSFLEKAEEKLKPMETRLYIMPGNDDYEEVGKFLEEHSSDVIIPIDQKVVDAEGYDLLGYGYSNITPWHTPREKDEDSIYKDLEKLAGGIDSKSIFAIHVPPYGTKIDKAPRLDKEMRQVMNLGDMDYAPVGSKSVRRFIEEHAPIVGLHGHVHEASGIDFIKAKNGSEVPVINPGSAYSSGILNGAIIEISNKLEKYVFTKG